MQEPTAELMVQLRPESEVVHENHTGRLDFLAVPLIEKVALDEFVIAVRFAPPFHQVPELAVDELGVFARPVGQFDAPREFGARRRAGHLKHHLANAGP